MREFVTAVRDAYEVDEGEEFLVHGAECDKSKAQSPGEQEAAECTEANCQTVRHYRPTEGQIAVYVASTGRHASASDRTAAVINFFVELFDKPSQAYLIERLLDRDDPFGLPEVEEMIEALTEGWSGRPTQPSAASTPSRRNGGRKSTPRTHKSISSGSPRIVSSTSSTPGA
jgi:hypothetical protein